MLARRGGDFRDQQVNHRLGQLRLADLQDRA
jgi:hypothetical protein